MNKYLLKIELKSDLCSGSGYSYGGIIDSDTFFDHYGLPLIPARRLKGCFRETAKNILFLDEDKINKLFGRSGDDCNKGFILQNAYMKDSEKLHKYIIEDKEISSIMVKELFTSIRSQTAMENGIAKDDSLRFTRVVNRNLPDSIKSTEFEAVILCEEELKSDLERIIRATRNIGLHRNRGLGSVKCSLCEIEESANVKIKTDVNYENGKKYVIDFTVKNIEQLVLSSQNDNTTISYINGASLRGCLASNYIKNGGDPSGDEFKKIFLGDTIFDNMYVCHGNDKMIPVPLFIRQLKKTKDIVNICCKEVEGSERDAGNRPKKLTGKYMIQGDVEKCIIKGLDKDIIYHHSKGNEEEQLYMIEVISPEQTFSGRIIADGENVVKIAELLNNSRMTFGKSKAAQYGMCEIISAKEIKEFIENKKQSRELMLVFASDTNIIGDNGEYTVNSEDIYKEIKDTLKVRYDIECVIVNENDDFDKINQNYIETKVKYGYNTKWNLKRECIPCISAGSCVSIKLEGDNTGIPEEFYMGEDNQIGCGHVIVYDRNKFKYKYSYDNDKSAIGEKDDGGKNQVKQNWISTVIRSKIFEKYLLANVLDEKIYFRESTELGKVTLMLKECYKEKGICGFLKEFKERKDKIKERETRENVSKYLSESTENFNNILNYKGIHLEDASEEVIKKFAEIKYKYMMALLVYNKYILAQR